MVDKLHNNLQKKAWVASNHDRLLAAQDLKISLAIHSLFSLVKAPKIPFRKDLSKKECTMLLISVYVHHALDTGFTI